MSHFADLPNDALGITLEVAVKQIVDYTEAAEAGDDSAAFHVRVGSELLTQVWVVLRRRGQGGDHEAQGLVDQFERWFYTVREKPVAH